MAAAVNTHDNTSRRSSCQPDGWASSYIIFNLIKKTRHTRATGVGFQRVTLSRPVPVPAPPIPGYPHGFVNPCHALVGNRKELCEFRICKSVEGSSFGSGGSDLWERGFIGSGVNGWH